MLSAHGSIDVAGARYLRNLFDQFSARENRLTHALVCALDRDSRLLRAFLKKVASAF